MSAEGPVDFCPKPKPKVEEAEQPKKRPCKIIRPDYCPPIPDPDPCEGPFLFDYTPEQPSRGPPQFPEEIFAWQWKRCLNDLMWKLGCGIFLGYLGSKLIFQKKKWPTIIGAGIGIGWASENCERELRSCFSSN
ncbi:unnamed protein product [Nezara viridula]|uniref:MICOS complex subunit MIC10 n=1 Tax=Nezara viridula TaxID=85310 RepID=A0A9P0HTP2_NEZVI|nr:unnamed protein product [Nezara viridula]